MDNLRREIKKQIAYCLNFERYKTAIVVSDSSKIEKVSNILLEIIKNIPQEFIKDVGIKTFGQRKFIIFYNSNSIKLFVASPANRAEKLNGCIVDKDISYFDFPIKGYMVYPMRDDNWLIEDQSEADKRVVEVKI